MSKAAREGVEGSVLERLDRIETLLLQLARKRAANERSGRKRSGTVAERAARDVRYRPTELQMAMVKRRLAGR